MTLFLFLNITTKQTNENRSKNRSGGLGKGDDDSFNFYVLMTLQCWFGTLENKINKEPFVLHLHSYHQNKQGFSSPKNPFGALPSLAYKAVRPERVSSALGTAFLPCNDGHSSAWQRPALPHEMHRDDHCSSLSPGTVPRASDSLVMWGN